MVRLAIYNKEDRLTVAKILVDNGYTVRQEKRKLTPTGKSLEYFLEVSKDDDSTSSEERS